VLKAEVDIWARGIGADVLSALMGMWRFPLMPSMQHVVRDELSFEKKCGPVCQNQHEAPRDVTTECTFLGIVTMMSWRDVTALFHCLLSRSRLPSPVTWNFSSYKTLFLYATILARFICLLFGIMAVTMTTAAKESKGFLELPGEVRNMVYDLLFQDSKLTLNRRAKDQGLSHGSIRPSELYNESANLQILFTCKTIRSEALPILAKHTALEIRNVFGRADPLQLFKPAFLKHVQTLIVDRDAFVHVPRKLLPALKHITVVERIDGISDLNHALHVRYCTACGGANVFLNEALRGVIDWKWMRTQIVHLSEEEGWRADFGLYWECGRAYNSGMQALVSPLISNLACANRSYRKLSTI
jgi:hypothetical protein